MNNVAAKRRGALAAALVAGLCAGTASAQTNITVYGIVGFVLEGRTFG